MEKDIVAIRGENTNELKLKDLHREADSAIVPITHGGELLGSLYLYIEHGKLSYTIYDPDCTRISKSQRNPLEIPEDWEILQESLEATFPKLHAEVVQELLKKIRAAATELQEKHDRWLEKEREKLKDRLAVLLEASEKTRLEAELDENGIKLLRIKSDGALPEVLGEKKIITGTFKPVRKIQLENGETIFEVHTSRVVRGTAPEILNYLTQTGAVVNRARASDAVNAILTGIELPTTKGHAAVGVYSNDGRLELCLEPYTRSDSQERIWRQIKRRCVKELKAEYIQPYLSVLQLWHACEVLPAFGLSVMAPFAYVLRENGILVPYLYHLSPESGLGKTELLKIFSTRLFGLNLLSSDAIRTEFRLADVLDSAGALVGIEEAESFPWNKHSAHLQAAAEQPMQNLRGTGGLGMRTYLSRAVFGFSGNIFRVKRKSTLVRLIKIDFDANAAAERRKPENRKMLKELTSKMRCAGWEIVRIATEALGSVERLIEHISRLAEAIEVAYPLSFKDPRRADVWAVIYAGVQMWEYTANQCGIVWKAPNVSEFVRDVVTPIESAMFEQAELPVMEFLNWWESWRALKRKTDGTIPGEDEIWRYAEIEHGGQKISGTVVTRALISEFEREMRTELPLSEIARGVEALTGIPRKTLMKTYKISGKVCKGVLIPDNIERTTTIAVGHDSDEKGGDDSFCMHTKNRGYLVTAPSFPGPESGNQSQLTEALNNQPEVTSSSGTGDPQGNQVTSKIHAHTKNTRRPSHTPADVPGNQRDDDSYIYSHTHTSEGHDTSPTYVRVRFLAPVPEFIVPDGDNTRVVGPFKPGDTATLPARSVVPFIKRGEAEVLSEEGGEDG